MSGLAHLHGFDDGDYSCGPEAADSGEDRDGQVVVRWATRLHQSDAIRHVHGHLARGNTWMRGTVGQVRLRLSKVNKLKDENHPSVQYILIIMTSHTPHKIKPHSPPFL